MISDVIYPPLYPPFSGVFLPTHPPYRGFAPLEHLEGGGRE